MKKIVTTDGIEIMVDDEDFEYLSLYNWGVSTSRYARVTLDGNTIAMHRMIMGVSGDDQVDHIDNNPFNNQKSNLRKCTRLENSRNRKMYKRNKSGYKGVTWYPRNEKWRASISLNGKVKWLGLFSDPKDAALAYDIAASREFGKFAKTNKSMGLLE